MAKNRLKSEEVSAKPTIPKRKRKASFFGNLNVNAFFIFENIHFIFYIAFLGLIYIANSHYAMKTYKEIKVLQADLKKISWESNSKKSELMQQSTRANVQKKVAEENLGLRLPKKPPHKIFIEE